MTATILGDIESGTLVRVEYDQPEGTPSASYARAALKAVEGAKSYNTIGTYCDSENNWYGYYVVSAA